MSIIKRFVVRDGDEAPWDDLLLLDIIHAEENATSLIVWAALAPDDEFDDDEDNEAWDADEVE